MSGQDNIIEFDVVFVGAGPASLSSALHLKHLISGRKADKDVSIAILEKSDKVSDHILSGAIFDDSMLQMLIPDYKNMNPPKLTPVKRERMILMSERHSLSLPQVVPQMSNRGGLILSLGELIKWLSKECERAGIEIYTSEAVSDLVLSDEGRVEGIVTKEKGVDKNGDAKENYMPGTTIKAKIVVLGEGSHGYVTDRLVERLALDELKSPQGHAVGMKEVWKVKDADFKPGHVYHTMGYPLGTDTFGGGFVYHFGNNHVALGLVISLDYRDSRLSPFDRFQKWKTHKSISEHIRRGELISYGAKSLSEGGYFTLPRLYGDGFLIIGEGGGLLNSMKLKGVPMAIQSGMFAAQAIADAMKNNDYSSTQLKSYEDSLKRSWVWKELKRARNFHQGFHRGLLRGIVHAAFQTITGGRGLKKRFHPKPDFECMEYKDKSNVRKNKPIEPDGKITFDRLSSVYVSGTKHEEDQPCHLIINDPSICFDKCEKEYGNPCQFFCPAKVYEVVTGDDGKKKIQINHTNCVHCKTCEIKDPYGIIEWKLPEGGGGPRYNKM